VLKIFSATLNTLRGLAIISKSETAFRIEAGVFALALVVGLIAAPSVAWYVAMTGAFLLVFAVELLNTAVEKLADHVTREFHPQIGMVKDFGSAAVFCALCLTGYIWLAGVSVRLGLL
jgi:diacylglycerol kinase (ATP)